VLVSLITEERYNCFLLQYFKMLRWIACRHDYSTLCLINNKEENNPRSFW